MTCVPFFDPGCTTGDIVGGLTGVASSIALSGVTEAIRGALTWVLADFMPLWLKLPAPDLASEPAVSAISNWLLPVTGAVAAAAMITATARMMLTRRGAPLLDIGTGLVTIAVVSALGIVLPDLLLQAGDTWSGWVLNASTHGQFTVRIGQLLNLSALPAVLIILLGVLAIVLVVVQAILLMFRQAGVILLAAVLPLAAAGSIAPLTRNWIRKTASWMLALICYKPAAAAVYAAAFTMIGKGSNPQAVVMGFAMLVLSLAALPVLMRFFTWTTGAVASSGGSGGLMSAATGGMVAVGALRAAGSGTAAKHAADLTSSQESGSSGSSSPGHGPSSATGSTGQGTGTASTGPGNSPASDSPHAATPASADQPSASASSPASATTSSPAAGAAAAGVATAGATVAAMIAAQSAAAVARNAAEAATDEGDRR